MVDRAQARAYWTVAPGRGEIRAAPLCHVITYPESGVSHLYSLAVSDHIMKARIAAGALGPGTAEALVSMRVVLRESPVAWASFEGSLHY